MALLCGALRCRAKEIERSMEAKAQKEQHRKEARELEMQKEISEASSVEAVIFALLTN